MFFGKARILESDEEIYHAAKILGLKFNPDKALVENEIKKEWPALCCIEITIDHMTGKEAIELAQMKKLYDK